MPSATLVGSGLLARAFAPHLAELGDACIYAAGVSNSSCDDDEEFARDRLRLQAATAAAAPSRLFVYFSTWSILDPWSQDSRYSAHKRELEQIVQTRDRFLVARLPQVAGKTPNPHTLLNYLYNRIARSERFDLWRNSTRNIIDVDDAAKLVVDLVANGNVEAETINIANPTNYTLPEIVSAMEFTARRRAIYNSVDKGGDYRIDTTRISDSVRRCGIEFDREYLQRTLAKYYG